MYFITKRLIILFLPFSTFAQSVLAPLNSDYYWNIDRYEVLSGNFFKGIHTVYKPYQRSLISAVADSASKLKNLSAQDRFNLRYLKNDNWEFNSDTTTGNTRKPVFKHYYEKKNALYQYYSKEFDIQINPVIDYEFGRESATKNTLNLNTRGIELRGMIGKKVGFYTFLADNQAFFPQYVNQRIDSSGAVPGEGFWKPFKTSGYDFFSARGYITFNIIKQIGVQFGNDKNFIGNGYRSLILSDFSAPYLFLKITTRVWKFQYTNLFCDMTAKILPDVEQYYPRKYMAFHQLSINITKNLNLGVFEAIVFQRSDSTTGNNGFELTYLNPVIFYREAESYLGSLDKVNLGADFKWNFQNHFSVYGQFVLNEFVLKNVVAQNGWWGNKYAWQIGAKYINAFGINNLDIQVENNVVRPFTYSDKNPETNFSNYQQPLASPLGANFAEIDFIVKYQPLNRVYITSKCIAYLQGNDYPGTNYGGNIFKSYTTRTLEYGNLIGQGNRTNVLYLDFSPSYMLFHNFFLDAHFTYRKQTDQISSAHDFIFMSGVRWNIAKRLNEY